MGKELDIQIHEDEWTSNHYFANKGLSSQGYGFSSGHVWMWELDVKVELNQFSQSVVPDSLQPHELQHTRPPCSSPTPGVHPNSCPSSRWCHPAISSSVIPFSSCPQSLPASGSFPMTQLFTSGGQSTGVPASASVFPKNTQDWSPLEWTGWISLQSRGFSTVFSNTKFKSINSSALSFLDSPTLTSIHDHWKNHSLDQMDLCWQSKVSAFQYAI